MMSENKLESREVVCKCCKGNGKIIEYQHRWRVNALAQHIQSFTNMQTSTSLQLHSGQWQISSIS